MSLVRWGIVSGLLLIAVLGLGCASGRVTAERVLDTTRGPRPTQIVISDFAVTDDEVAIDTSFARTLGRRQQPLSAEQLAVAHSVARDVSEQLVAALNGRGLPARRGAVGEPRGEGDLLVHGAFISVDEGSRTKRMLIGFGAGASQVRSHVSIAQVRGGSPVLLEEFEVTAESSKMPGMAVPVGAGAAAGRAATSAAVSGGLSTVRETRGPLGTEARNTATQIADRLESLFEKRGWSAE